MGRNQLEQLRLSVGPDAGWNERYGTPEPST